MKKLLMMLIFAIIALIVACTKPVKAGEFITTPTECFFGRSYTIEYQNDVPSKSSMYYFAYSVNNGTTWKNLTEPTVWINNPVQFTFKVKETGVTKIGIFCKIDNEWVNSNTFSVVCKYSDKFSFASYPDTIFNNSEHQFYVKFDPSEAPDEMTLRYSIDNGSSWRRWETYTIPENKSVMTMPLSNGNIKNPAIFQLYYDNPVQVVCETPTIPYKEKEVFLKVLNKWGQREIGTNEIIEYEKSSNFKYVKIVTYFDNALVNDFNYFDGKSATVKFNKNGEYNIDCVVDDGNFRIVQMAKFTVGNPCEVAIKEGIIFRDSCERTLARLNELKEKYNEQDSLNEYLSDKNDSLNVINLELKKENEKLKIDISKIRKDSINLKLIYNNGVTQTVKDETTFSKTKSIFAEIVDGGVYVVLPLELRQNETSETTWWCFSMNGELLDSGFHSWTPIDILIRKNLVHGMYIFYTLQDGKYIAYKFII